MQAAAHRRVLAAVGSMSEESAWAESVARMVRARHHPSGRNADSHVWLFEGARLGEIRSQYPQPGMRETDINAGATRTADELASDFASIVRNTRIGLADLDDGLWEREASLLPVAADVRRSSFVVSERSRFTTPTSTWLLFGRRLVESVRRRGTSPAARGPGRPRRPSHLVGWLLPGLQPCPSFLEPGSHR